MSTEHTLQSTTEHTLDASRVHHNWDNSRESVVAIRSGDVVHFELLMAGHGQVTETSSIEDVEWDFDTIYNLSGPIFVEGAEPGDSLEIEILQLQPGEWGWTAILSDFGLLPMDFPDPYLKIFDLRSGTHAALAPGINVPFNPFLGTMGVPTDEPGTFMPFPPHKGGGNLDNRHLITGSTLWLPVWCKGALFSCGDAHAAQGDGEVCVSAIECDMTASLRIHLRKQPSAAPAFKTPGAVLDTGPHYGTMGIDPDLMEGARKAARAMISWLVDEHDLTREDAYVLCSIAANLHIHEIVDAGVWNVGMTVPLSVFTSA
jgi:acetamidase/formamidase